MKSCGVNIPEIFTLFFESEIEALSLIEEYYFQNGMTQYIRIVKQ
jgi:hypothetical protein